MKNLFCAFALGVIPLTLHAQSVPAAYSISQQDLKGTARFMSMAGAFGALGGDISTLSQNPGGIGVYRSNDISFTLGLDMYNTKSQSLWDETKVSNTKFNLNNIGGVFTLKLYNSTIPNINFGFSYNKVASFNRRYKGTVPQLQTSLSNYIAGVCNSDGLNEADVSYGDNYDPYNPPTGSRNVPWISVLGYYGFLTNPEGDPDDPHWEGQFGSGTSGKGSFDVLEKGSVDEFNIALGGNISNKVFWGLDFGITALEFSQSSIWAESLDNAYVYDPNTDMVSQTRADWSMHDNYRINGTGFNFKLGLIYKPIQELRLGLAFHTPTFYNLTEKYYDIHLDYNYPFHTQDNSTYANDGYPVANDMSFKSPWRVIASVAGVVGQKLIVSADYEWSTYGHIKYGEPDYGYYDPWWDWDNPWNGWGDWYYAPSRGQGEGVSRSSSRYSYQSPNDYANSMIKATYRDTHTLRFGAEYRILSSLSVRAGYCFTSSPVTKAAKNYKVAVPGTGVLTNYSLDNSTNYITCGVGYRNKGFYADLAYVYKHFTSEYFPFSIDLASPQTAPKSHIVYNNSNFALTFGYKF